jgi:putative FmdB family regulatory protein
MPTYVYACDSCGAQFEQFQSFKDEPVRTCPRCEAGVRRVFQPVGIVFKGSGWYITDSRKSETASVASDGAKVETKSDTAGGDAKAEAKSETKAEAKAEAKSETNSTSAAKPATA